MNDWLAHYGVKGQKWGVRRYQNEDGTWTEEGKAHKRGWRLKTLSADELADKLSERAKKREPKITKDVKRAALRAGSKLHGLENKLKTKQSLERKIHTDAVEKEISEREAAMDIKDSVRYTSISDDDNFVDNYNSMKDFLEKQGYEEVRCKNYWDLYRQGKVKHKSVQSVFKAPDGYEFEIQFQTPLSQLAKDRKVPLYEERRQLGVSEKRAAVLERKMEKLADNVPTPIDIYSIKTH